MFSFLWKTSKGTASYTLCWSTPSLEIFNRGPAKNNLRCSQCIIQTNLIKRHPQLQPSVAQRGGPELQLVPLHRRLFHPPHHHHPQVILQAWKYQILDIRNILHPPHHHSPQLLFGPCACQSGMSWSQICVKFNISSFRILRLLRRPIYGTQPSRGRQRS